MLGGDDVYSGSKAGCEIIANSFRKSFLKTQIVKLLPLELEIVLVAAIGLKIELLGLTRVFFKKQKFNIKDARCNSTLATCNRTVIWLYSLSREAYVKKSGQFAKAWNFGPSTKQNMKVIDLVNLIKKQMQTNSRILIKRQFKKINKKYTSFESKYLNIDSSNVFKALKWSPSLSIRNAVELTVEWHKVFLKKVTCLI